MNTQSIKSQWLEMRGEMQRKWRDISSDEFEGSYGRVRPQPCLIPIECSSMQDQIIEKRAGLKSQFESKYLMLENIGEIIMNR